MTTAFSVSVEDVPLYAGPINWDLSGAGNGPKQVVDFFDISASKKLKGGPLQKVAVALTQPARRRST